MNDNSISLGNSPAWPQELYSEILPGLWQGGTDDSDVFNQFERPQVNREIFDSVYTLYAFANPVDWHVKEIRYGFYDDYANLTANPAELYRLARQAHRDWKRGERVLIRCQAGLNRSGLIAALVLIREGYTPVQAIDLLRSRRATNVLMNPLFEQWILEQEHGFQLLSSAA